jgi:hypothetical protein
VQIIQGGNMSGGRKINDHGFFAGSGSPRFPKGVHTKDESSAEGFGNLAAYEDTSEAIKSQQTMNKTKVHGHPQKPGHRN